MRKKKDRIEAVMRVVEAAARLARPVPRWVDALAQSTGLSSQGVELALREHLEHDAKRHDVETLVESTVEVDRVFVVLSSNVFVGALRAVALAVASSPRVTVKVSRRDPTFAKALVHTLADAAVDLTDTLDIAALPPSDLHIYGSSETIDHVRAAAPTHVRVWAHGSGLGLADVDGRRGDVSMFEDADALARDIVAFDQRGCLSPRLCTLRGTLDDGVAFARALALALRAWEDDVPTGQLSERERADVRRLSDTAAMAGAWVDASTGGVAVMEASAVAAPCPVGRSMVVAVCGDGAARNRFVETWAPWLTTVGTHRGKRKPWMPTHVRPARLGSMQRPPLDGPVDLRELPLPPRNLRASG